MNLKKLKNNKKGFTLIEIIVVVVILAVLMAVAVPAVMSYLDEADNAKFETAGHAVYVAAQTEWAKDYAGDKKVKVSDVITKVKTRVEGDDSDTTVDANNLTIYKGTAALTGESTEKTISKVVVKLTINGDTKTVTITGNDKVSVS